jgi:cytochrome oxidase Cu insertion factor (SCO1/SenC/PrrC family)
VTRRLLATLLAVAVVAVAAVTYARSHGGAEARDRLTGIALTGPVGGAIIVHHEPFAGMPAMTMTFSVPAGTVVHPGDRITADVDTTAEPWALSSVAVTAAPVPRSGPQIAFLDVGDRVPATPFIDAAGRAVTLAALRGRPYALTFIYTRCRDPRMCPFVSAKLHLLQTRTAGSPIALVEVSLDPAYDRPPVLRRYGALFGADPARWQLFTGDPRTVLDFAARFRILERSAGPDTIVHTERLAIVDATGRIRRFYDDPNWRIDDVARALRAPSPRA